jgi:ureidoglycolate lyase
MKTLIETSRATSTSFARYGSVLETPAGDPTASGSSFRYWSDLAHFRVDGETEIGLCTVNGHDAVSIAWMERHDRTPEILVPIDAPFHLPVMNDSGEVELFRVEPGEAVVIDAGVWHSVCIPAGAAEARYLVIFRRGTPAEDVVKRDIPAVRLAEEVH